MITRKTLLRLTAVCALVLTPVAVPPMTATAAPVPYGDCRTWKDGNTFGAACTGGGRAAYMAVAVCKNGESVGGRVMDGESGLWSYAYCTSVNSSLSRGYVRWFL
ncbi:hypothetical protein ACF05T_33810 [Streptomyces lateritius]|uniref:Secreted protein n=1 Tax=Streptomyces lateritius TaxID=67313 RepID=A0ABW6YMH0_9ACTN